MADIHDDVLRTVSEQAAVYQVDEDAVARHRQRMGGLAGTAYAAGRLTAAVVAIASRHRDDCTLQTCGTCDLLRPALEVALAGAREMTDRELTQMLTAPATVQMIPPAAERPDVVLRRKWWRSGNRRAGCTD